MSIEHEQEPGAFVPVAESQPTEIKGIVRDPNIFGGKPIISGHRIAVHDIAEYARQGYTAQRIVSEVYTHLSLVQVYAALHYYYEHKEEIDREIAEDRAYVKARAQEDMSPLAQRLRQHIKERREKEECSREQDA